MVGVAPSPRPPDGFLTVRCISDSNSSIGMTYTIGQVNGSFPFVLNSTTGSFSVTQDLVYATQPHSYSFSVWCYDNLSPNLSSNASVTISVMEVDKYKPVIAPSYVFLTLNETTPLGTVVASTRRDVGALSVYTATDMDVGPQGALYYNLYYSDPRFSADRTFGTLTVQQSLSVDYIGATTFINIIITACDPHVCSSDFNEYITILRQNDHYPMFSQKVYSVTYNDGTPPGEVIPSICTDEDIGVGALQGVVFLNTTPGVFLLNAATGVLTTNISMDYRRARGYTVVLLCSDTGGLTNTSTVYVTITPPPNYTPFLYLNASNSNKSYTFNVSKTTPPLYTIGQITAMNEIIWSTTLTYSLESNPYFIIDSLNGTIQTISSVFDYPYSEIVLNATVTDGLFNDTVAVHMVLTPGNLNSPVFTPGERSFDINELSPIGTSVATFQCTDADNGTNGQISYSITAGNINGAFQMNPVTDVIQVANLLILPQNIASYPYQLTIQCSDHGVPIKSNVTMAYFNVYQDNALRNFTSGFIAYVNENANINDTVITINASFQYPSTYSFIHESVPNVFTIDVNTGVVRVAAHLDHDTVPVYNMTVVAIRSVDPARNSSALLTIYVRAVNKYRPQCMSIFNPTILDTTAVGSTVLQLSCSDADTGINGAIVYSLSMNYEVLGINNDTGAIYISNPLDSISYSVLNLTVLVSDRGSPPLSNSYPIIIFVTFTVHKSPVFTNLPASLNLSDSTQTGVIFFTAAAINPNRVTTELLTYSITSGLGTSPFQIYPNSGGIILLQPLDYYSIPNYTLTITASVGAFTATSTLSINVVNTNKYDPVCLSTLYVVNVPENATVQTVLTNQTVLLNLSCFDANKGPGAQLVYRIVAGNGDGKFSIINNGLLTLVQGLNYANATQYQLVINVSDTFPVPRIISVTVYIFVQPVNTFSPVFQQSFYSYTIPENSPIGTSVLLVTATDGDSPASPDGQVTYSLVGLNQPKFTVDRSGWIILASNLDILQQAVYNITVLAMDGGKPPRTGSASVVIYVGYVGIRPPQFTQSLYYTALNTTNPSTVLTVHCTDPVLGNIAPIRYSLDPSLSSSRYFNVDPNSGVITIKATLPSSDGHLTFRAICTGSAPYNLSDTAVVDVELLVKSNITFIPSASCLFLPPHTYNCTLPESVQPVYTILQVNATSPGGYAITYSLINYQTTFSIDPSSGYFRLIGMLEYEQQQDYVITIQASPVGPLGPNMAQATVLVYVDNVNDEVPVIAAPQNVIYVPENIPASTVVANFTCTDADSGTYGRTQFSIIGGNVGGVFSISPSGQLQVNRSIKYSVTQIYYLLLLCADGGSPPLSANTTVPIIVVHLNSEAPQFNTSSYTFSISKGLVPPAPVGSPLVARDADLPPFNNLWYIILSGDTFPATFTIDPTSGQLILIRSLNYQMRKTYQLVVEVQDGGGLSDPGYPVLTGNTTVNIEVAAANLHSPQFSQSVYSGTIQLSNGSNIGYAVLGVQVTCTDQDNGINAQTSLSVTGGNVGNVFNITEVGYVYVQKNLPSSQAYPSYILTVTCQDMGSPPLNNSALVIVGVTGGNLFAPQFNKSIYNFSIPDSTGAGTVIGVVSAANPNPGIGGSIFYALNSTGSAVIVDSNSGHVYIAYQPVTSGVYVYTVTATNSLALNSTATLILTVVSINRTPPYFSQPLYFASVSEHAPVTTVVTNVTCTTPGDGTNPNPNKYSSNTTTVPFSIDPVVGLVTVNGTLNATVTRTYTLSVICHDLDGNTLSVLLTINIIPYNNYAPIFVGAPYSTYVAEYATLGTLVATVSATDADLAPYNVITYSIVGGNEQGKFFIYSSLGTVRVVETIGPDHPSFSYVLTVRAQNVIPPGDPSGSPSLLSETTLTITVLDENDNSPVLQPMDVIRLFANGSVVPNTIIVTFTCTDSDTGSNGATHFSISTNISSLAIFPNGSLIATGTISSNLSVEVICADMASPPRSTTTQVTIFTSSNNLHAPTFNSTTLYASVPGDTATVGQTVGCYPAMDLDSPSTPDGTITYTLDMTYSNDSISRFGVKVGTGCIFVVFPLQRSAPFYSYLLTATDQGSPAKSGSAVLLITVTFAVQSPHFVDAPYAISVPENATSGSAVASVLCADDRPSSTFVYNITGGNGNGSFAINTSSGVLYTTSVGLNYETAMRYTLQVRCTNSIGLFATTSVYVSVLQVNEFTPTFTVPVGVSIPENAALGASVVQLNWTDGDAGSDGEVTFSITGGNDGNAFSITSNGLVFVSGALDRETKPVYILQITITDLSPTDPKSSTNNITITVTDVNDNAPVFTQNLYVFQLQGTEVAGYLIGTVHCTDNDTGVNGQVTYVLASASSYLPLFSLDMVNGTLSLAAPASGRSANGITLTVMCTDMGMPSLSGSATVLISVNETNHYAPQFTNQSYAAVISESTPVLTPILNVSATDRDTGLYGMVHYSLLDTINGIFYMDDSTGQLLLLRTLNYVMASQYFLVAVATDGAPGVLYRRTATANVTIQVLPTNRYDPCCPNAAYSTHINLSRAGVILNFGCYDNDTGLNGMLTYSIKSGNVNGVFTAVGGSLMVPSAVPPNANITQYNLVMQVNDMGMPSRQAQVQITVYYLFANQYSPVFGNMQYSFNVSEVAPVGTSVYQVKANDEGIGLVGVVRYSISGTDKFLIDSASGTIFVSKALDWKSVRSINFSVIAQDQDPLAPRSSSAGVLVTVLNGNVNPPSCPISLINAVVSSASPVNSAIVILSCSDPDGSPFTYQLIGGGGSSVGIGVSSGMLYVAGPLIPSTSSFLTINVTDGVNRPTQVFVNLKVLFTNQYPPQFVINSPTFSVSETASLLTQIGTVVATDMDSANSSLTYSIPNSSLPFYIDASSGSIFLVSPLNYEAQTSYTFVVKVQDGGSYNGSNVLSSITPVTVTVLNVNENAPQFSNGGIYGAAVPKNASIGTTVLNLQCTDTDSPPYVSISSSGFSGKPFNLTQNNVTVSQSPIGSGIYTIPLTCSDGGNLSTNGSVFIIVPDPAAPAFTQSIYVWTLPENTSTGLVYAQVKASSTDQSAFTYSIVYGNSDENFYINTKTGDIILVEQLHYAAQQSYALVVQAQDSSNRQSHALVRVQVLQGPGQVPRPSALLSIQQGWPVGYPFGSLQCPDGTVSNVGGSQSVFSFLNAPASMLFGVDRYGVVSKQAVPDSTPVYATVLTCYNVPDLVGTGTATIQVSFVNNYAPQFALTSYDAIVLESATILSSVATVSAIDMDIGSYGNVTYSILAGNPNKFFINPVTGDLGVLTPLNYEVTNTYNLTVVAVDGGPAASPTQRRTGTTSVVIKLQNVNEYAPIPDQQNYIQTISTNYSAFHDAVLTVHCSDSDSGDSIYYSLVPYSQDFVIQSNGTILLARNQTQQSTYSFSAVCTDSGGLWSSALVTVVVNPSDVGYPVFAQPLYSATIAESQSVSSTIMRIQATSTDSSVGIAYAIVSGSNGTFVIDGATGDIVLAMPLNAELQGYYVLLVKAVTTGCIPKMTVATVVITVTDVNEYSPSFGNDTLTVSIIESSPPPTFVANVTCNDADVTSNISYQISSDSGVLSMFGISPEGVIFTSSPLDYESYASYVLKVTCSDGGPIPKSATTAIGITVKPVNEHIPQFTQPVYQFNVTEHTPGLSPGYVTATDQDAGTQGEVTYIPLDPGNSSVVLVEPSTGRIVITSSLDYVSQTTWNISIIARDGGGLESYTTLIINVISANDNAPVLTPTLSVQTIPIGAPYGYPIQTYSCIDPNGGSTNLSIFSGNSQQLFVLNRRNQLLWGGSQDPFPLLSLILICIKTSSPNLVDYSYVAITNSIQNATAFHFSSTDYQVRVLENSTVGSIVVTVVASPGSGVRYSLLTTSFTALPFAVNQTTGNITLTSALNSQQASFYSFLVNATNANGDLSVALVEVTVVAVNTKPPTISLSQNITLFRSQDPAQVAFFVCYESNSGLSSSAQFTIVSGNINSTFAIRSNGIVDLMGTLLNVPQTDVTLSIACTINSRTSSSTNLFIHIIDTEVFTPVFDTQSYHFNISEIKPIGAIVGSVNASSKSGGLIQYTITGGNGAGKFGVNPLTGLISLLSLLNYVIAPNYTLTVTATDQTVFNSLQTSLATVYISVIYSNSRNPTLSPQGEVVFTVDEYSLPQSIGSFTCSDPYGTNVNFTMSPQTTLFAINSTGTVKLLGLVGYSVATLYTFNVTCSSTAPIAGINAVRTASSKLIIVIRAVNRFAPNVSSAVVPILEDQVPFTSITQVQVTDLDNRGYFSYSLSDSSVFLMDTSTGQVYLKASNPPIRNYTLTVSVSDNDPAAAPRTGTATLVVLVTIGSQPQFVPADVISFEVYIPLGTPSSTQLNVTAVSSQNVRTQNSSIQYVNENVVHPITQTLKVVHGNSKLRLINEFLVTTATIETSDNNATYNLTLSNKYFSITRRLVIIVTTGTQPTSQGLPLAVIITIVVMASVLFLALFFCVISSICYCIMRHNRNNNTLKSR